MFKLEVVLSVSLYECDSSLSTRRSELYTYMNAYTHESDTLCGHVFGTEMHVSGESGALFDNKIWNFTKI